MVNGQEYGWEDVQVVVQGKNTPLTGVKAISYDSSKVHENIHGRGNRPVAMGRGKEDWEGKLTILQSELEAMQVAFGNRSLVNRPAFAITVAYAPEEGPLTTDILQGVRITKVSKAISGEDTHMTVDLELKIFNVKYGAL